MIDYDKLRDLINEYIYDSGLTESAVDADLHSEALTLIVEEALEEELSNGS